MTASVIADLLRRGVVFPAPELVHVAPDVDPRRIEAGAVLFPFARVEGARTLIGRGARVGSAGPATVKDCAVGRDADLASGTFEEAVFLDGAAFGPAGHARAGTLFEEGARAAHGCGVKQTILLPYATLGSLINFCDCLLAGGTGADDHSEVGSGFIHFNFSPTGAHGDKAAPSLFGDAVHGVFLRERRIFLGGDAGVVGPVKIGYGTVLAAGTTYRRDRGADRLVYAERLPDRERAFDPRVLRNAREKVAKNLDYLAQLAALRAFYVEVRGPVVDGDAFATELVAAAMRLLDGAAKERVRQLERLAPDFERSAELLLADGGAEDSPEVVYQRRFAAEFSGVRQRLTELARAADATHGARAAAGWSPFWSKGSTYLRWVAGLTASAVEAGRARLQAVVDAYLSDPEGAKRLL
jgi:bifunctional UDP-N-acetylglucosamine pyrophosphorylase / glucosamine-1-phosphate N-acetyltransferase